MVAESAASKAALASGEWKAAVDPKSRKTYYVNKSTKKTVWNLDEALSTNATPAPTGSALSPSASVGGGGGPHAATTAAVRKALESGEWAEKKDPKSGRSYYVQRETKKTVWDLEKELGGAEPAATATATAPAAATGDAATDAASASQPAANRAGGGYAPRTVADVLREGEWVEKVDPKKNKPYYYNKKTRKTTWDLAKELGLDKPPSGGEASSATLAASAAAAAGAAGPASQRVVKVYDAKQLLAAGVWEVVKDLGGNTYFMKRETGETTADLELYLQIQQALDDADDVSPLVESQQGTSDWVSLIIRAPGHERAADRLIAPYIQGRVDDADRAVKVAQQREDAARRELTDAERTIMQLKGALAGHQHEIHQLQCAVFYGMGGGGGGAAAGGRGGGVMPPYAPTVMDPIAAAAADRNPSSLATRVEYLERLLHSTQGHNRKLQEEIEALRRRGHESATCRHCSDNDPWTRVLRSAAPIESATTPFVSGSGAATAAYPSIDASAPLVPRSLLEPSRVVATRDAPAFSTHLSGAYVRGSVNGTLAASPAQTPSSPLPQRAPWAHFASGVHDVQYVGARPQIDLHRYPSTITSTRRAPGATADNFSTPTHQRVGIAF
jgi:hypothetical protein